jgi:lambda family phage portal protein
VDQSRGSPWAAAAMLSLHHLDKYEEAEVVAARIAAAKMAFFTKAQVEGAPDDGEDSEGNLSVEATPGGMMELPTGYDVKPWTPEHPNTAYKEFVKGKLREIAAGCGVNYNTLASDYEATSYSSLRGAALDERETYKLLQRMFIDDLIQPIFDAWLEAAVYTGKLSFIPPSEMDWYNAPDWKPRRWAWVDPLKDIQASSLEVEKGFRAKREIISEKGGDIEDVYADMESDNQLAEQHGLSFGAQVKPEPEPEPEPEDDETTPPSRVNGNGHLRRAT